MDFVCILGQIFSAPMWLVVPLGLLQYRCPPPIVVPTIVFHCKSHLHVYQNRGYGNAKLTVPPTFVFSNLCFSLVMLEARLVS